MAKTVVTFDDREHAVRAAFAGRIQGREDVVVECRRLEMGDVHIQCGSPLIVVERKQVSDLMSSLFDGRLAEQCSRMRQWQSEQATGEVWTVVIVEGCAGPETFRAKDPDAKFRHQAAFCGVPKKRPVVHFVKTCLQLALDAQPAECRLVLRTTSVDETAALLLTLHKTITAGVETAKRAWTGGMPRKTQSNAVVRHLCCTQGVSQQRAQRVHSRYASVMQLSGAFHADPDATVSALTELIGSRKVALRVLEDVGVDTATSAPLRPPVRKRRCSPRGEMPTEPNRSRGSGRSAASPLPPEPCMPECPAETGPHR